MNTFYSIFPYICSAFAIIFCVYSLTYLSLSKKKYNEAEEKAIKRAKKMFPIAIIIATLNILVRLFWSL